MTKLAPKHSYIPQVLRQLFNQKNKPPQDNLITHFRSAAATGDTAKCQSLIERGIDVNARDAGGRTPLHWAAQGGHTVTVLDLIERGADVNIRDNGGWTALHEAAMGGHTDTVMALIERGADVNARNNSRWMALNKAALDTSCTALQFAVSNGHTDTAEKMQEAVSLAHSGRMQAIAHIAKRHRKLGL